MMVFPTKISNEFLLSHKILSQFQFQFSQPLNQHKKNSSMIRYIYDVFKNWLSIYVCRIVSAFPACFLIWKENIFTFSFVFLLPHTKINRINYLWVNSRELTKMICIWLMFTNTHTLHVRIYFQFSMTKKRKFMFMFITQALHTHFSRFSTLEFMYEDIVVYTIVVVVYDSLLSRL